MVVDRQKIKTRSEARRYRVAGRLEVRAGKMVRQVGSESRQARVTTRRTSRSRAMGKKQENGGEPTLVDLTN